VWYETRLEGVLDVRSSRDEKKGNFVVPNHLWQQSSTINTSFIYSKNGNLLHFELRKHEYERRNIEMPSARLNYF
jgi:hypothetical protein